MSSDENIELHYVLKIYEEHGRFNRDITTVADEAWDSDGCLDLSQPTGDTAIIFNRVIAYQRYLTLQTAGTERLRIDQLKYAKNRV